MFAVTNFWKLKNFADHTFFFQIFGVVLISRMTPKQIIFREIRRFDQNPQN